MTTKVIDKRNQSEAGEYGVAFAARDEHGSVEHAFIVWYFSDPAGNRTNHRAAGFYPTGDPTAYDLIVSGVPGKVFDDSHQSISQQLIVLVNKAIYDECVKVEGNYNNATYRLLTKDCVSFVADAASAIPGLQIPNRALNWYPSTFVSALFEQND